MQSDEESAATFCRMQISHEDGRATCSPIGHRDDSQNDGSFVAGCRGRTPTSGIASSCRQKRNYQWRINNEKHRVSGEAAWHALRGLSSTLAEPLALSSLPLHPSQLGPSLRDILKKDIIKRGRIVVSVIKDKLGNILEGKIPQEIADELGYKNIPTITLAGLSDQEKQEVRVIFNLARRQMTREQIRGLNGN